MTAPITAHLANLNSAQRRAVTFGEIVPGKPFRSGPLLIVAGAGTGKTSTLAARVAHLVIHGVDPARIMMLTFSRRAAQEMRRRARDIVKTALAETIGGLNHALIQRLQWAGTFHAIGNRLLRHYARQIGLDPGFSVLDRGDAADLVDSIREELGFAAQDKRFPRKDTCLAIYSHRVNTGLSLAEALDAQFPWCKDWAPQLTQLFRAYVERKTQLSLLDYDDLLFYWHAMMQEQRIAAHIGGHFDHVLVDEYQDTNPLQAQIVRALKPDGAGVTVVGDDAQAIYSFRAAAVENILEFPGQYQPRADVVALAQNYRSTQAILDASNGLMSEAPRQFRKQLISSRGAGVRPRLVAVDDLAAQAEYVCTSVLRRRESGIALKRQAVLFRTGTHSDLLEIELTRRAIPFVKYGGLKFLEAAHVKDLLSLLRFADNPRNDLAAFRCLQLMPGMGPVNARNAIRHFEAAGRSFASLAEFAAPPESRLHWKRFADLMADLSGRERPWPGQVRLVRDWYKPHFERIYEHVHTRIGDLDQLEQLSAHYTSRERFLTELTLDPPQATSDLAGTPLLDEDFLVLSTVHSAKGMEWSSVTILNVVDGSFPSEFATRSEAQIEEGRRLLYVAMTRAQDDLSLVQPLRFAVTSAPPRSDAHVYGGRSRFLTDKVLAAFDQHAFHAAEMQVVELDGTPAQGLDVTQRSRELW